MIKWDKKGIGFSMIVYLILGVLVLLVLTIFFTKGFSSADSSTTTILNPANLFNQAGGAIASIFTTNEDASSQSTSLKSAQDFAGGNYDE